VPEDIPVLKLAKGIPTRVSSLLFISNLAPSRAEGERLIKQKAVEIDGHVIDDPRKEVDLSKPVSFVLRSGKRRYARIVVE
jgi:tyrosyl-tRNA synthetase